VLDEAGWDAKLDGRVGHDAGDFAPHGGHGFDDELGVDDDPVLDADGADGHIPGFVEGGFDGEDATGRDWCVGEPVAPHVRYPRFDGALPEVEVGANELGERDSGERFLEAFPRDRRPEGGRRPRPPHSVSG